MKRFTKIFVVALAVSLIFGALAMTASAALVSPATPGGMYHKLQNKFDENSVGPVSYGGTNTNIVSGSGVWKISNAHNSDTVAEIVEGEDGNKYFLFTGRGKGNVYVATGYGGANIGQGKRPALSTDGSTVTDNNDVVSRTPFVIADIDIMSPTGNFITSTIGMELRTFKAGDTGIDQVYVTDANGNPINQGGSITIETNAAGESYIYLAGEIENKKMINPYEFTRLTVIYEGVDNPNGADKNDTINVYLYVNGEFFAKRCGAFPEWGYAGDKPVLTWDELRFNVGTNKDDPTKTVAIDNLNMYCAGVSYLTKGGNLGSILDAESTLEGYDGYETQVANQGDKPFGVSIAQVGETKFDNIDKAMAAVEEGGEIQILKDITAPVFATKEVKFVTNGFSINVEADKEALLGAKVDEDGNVVVESVEGKFVYVEWDNCYCEGDGHFDDEGNVDPAYHPLFNEIEELYIYSSYYEAYNPTFEGLVGGENVVLAGWEVNGEILPVDAIVTAEDVEAGFISITPVYKKYVTVTWEDANGNVIGTSQALQGTVAEVPADLKGVDVVEGFLKARPSAWLDLNVPADATEFTVKADPAVALEIYADVEFLLTVRPQDNINIIVYIPELPANIEYVDFAVNSGTNRLANATTAKINGKIYKGGQGWLGTDTVYGDSTSKLTFKYDGVEYSDEVKFNLADYANAVLNIEGYTEDAKDFVVNMAKYYSVMADARSKATTEIAQEFKAIVDNNTSRVVSIDPATAKKAEASEYIKSVQLAIGSYANTYTITFTAEAAAVLGKESIVYEKATLASLDDIKIQAGDVTYVFNLENYVAALYEAGANEQTMNVIIALYGYRAAQKAYNS